MISFEWDEEKAILNSRKHGVSFDEAKTVFGDPLARFARDDEHSFEERRLALIGRSEQGRALIVSFAEREGDRIRIISARELTPRESRDYADRAG